MAAETPTLLFVYAHPDDEQGVTGAMALYLNRGYRVGLICATRGEMGEIAPGVDATPETLGIVREQEMRNAIGVIGPVDLWFLDYRDSGMAGSPANQDSDAYIQAPDEEAVGRIVQIVRQYKPHVIVTFDPTGIYQHPDHVAVHRHATAAFNAAGDPHAYPEAGAPWQPLRLFYSAIPRSGMQQMAKWMSENAPAGSFDMGVDWNEMGVPDEEISNTIDVADYVDLKLKSVAQHASQMPPDSPFTRMVEENAATWRAQEFYMLVAGQPLPEGSSDDLFAGLDV